MRELIQKVLQKASGFNPLEDERGHYFEPGNLASDPSVCGSLGGLFSL